MNIYYKKVINQPSSIQAFPLKEKTVPSNSISRRKLKPLLVRASEVVKTYQKAVDCVVSVLDQTGHPIAIANYKKVNIFCDLCRKHYPDRERVWGEDEYPCTQMHIDGLTEAVRVGGTFIYTCELGFIYWISLIYSGGHQAGALIAGRVLCVERQQAIERICGMGRGAISEDEARSYLADIPERTYEEIKAQAQMLGFCAEQLSASIEDYNKTIKAPVEQQSNPSSPIHLEKKRPLKGLSAQKADKQISSSGYPLDKERLLLAALRRGDKDASKKILHELLDLILAVNAGSFEFIQLKAIELVVLLSREALSSDISTDRSEYKATLEVNNRYLHKIQESKTLEELFGNLYGIIDRMAGQMFSFQGVRHASALRKAERYIWEHYTHKVSLKEIADVSGLSASYFSSIFKKEMGENLSNYLNRLRTEKAAAMLTETDAPLYEIAQVCGFEDQSWFSKIFKSYTGVSPGKYREQGCGILSATFEEEQSQTGA
jgi:AraC-like DNA-binding protein/ligand-binding sensor protein